MKPIWDATHESHAAYAAQPDFPPCPRIAISRTETLADRTHVKPNKLFDHAPTHVR